MGTDINIKKKIAIQEESVTITPDVNSINFTGAGVTATPSGDDVIVNIPGSIGATVYYLNETITQAPYKEFSSFPTAAAEQTIATAVGVGATVTIQSFQTPSGVPNTTNIPAGLWQFYLHFSGTFGDSWDVYAEVYKRDLGGIETLLLTTDVIPTTALSAIPTMILTDGVFPASTVLTTDRIVVKVLAVNTGVAGQTITFHTEGSTNYSVGTTTLNQIVPAGAVTSVTGTAPVVSSGGTTPAISMAQANGSTDGYLDSADWTTFNSKQDPITLTTTGTSGAATLIANTLNIPQYQAALLLTTVGTSGPATLIGNTLNIPSYSFTDTNIYNTDGTLTGNRIVTMNANTLLFDGTNSDIRYTPNSVGGYLQLEGKASGVPRFGISVPAFGLNPAAGFQLGMRAWDDPTFAGYGQVGDAFFYAGNATYGLNFLNPPGVGTADYIRFYAGIDATGTSHMHIQGTGGTKGYIGIGTETPTEKLDVAGKTRTTTFQMTTAPASGYIMTSDASGNGSWTIPSSASVNIYNSDGTLSANRIVNLVDKTITFYGTDLASLFEVSLTDGGSNTANLTAGLLSADHVIANNTWQSSRFQQASTLINKVQNLAGTDYTDTTHSSGSFLIRAVTGATQRRLEVDTVGIRVNNAFYLPNVDGTSGQVLRTNGIGITSWVTPTDTNIYNSNGTLTGNRTVTMSGNTLNFSGGNIGINQPTPSVPLHVKGTAIPSVNESLARFEVSDATGAYLGLDNASLVDGEFVPQMIGRQNSSSTQSALYVSGAIDATQDAGTTPVTIFRSALASLTQVVTRPIFAFKNWSTDVMNILANGNVGIGTTAPAEKLHVNGKTRTNTFQMTTAPTAGYVLTSDASGNGTWSPAAGGSSTWNVTTQAGASYTAASNDYVLVNAATQTVTLPAAANGIRVGVKMINATVTNIRVLTPSAGVTIDGTDRSVTGLPILNQYDAYTFVCDGTNWWIMG